ncbi:MAG: glycosyltransferase [Vicinamibacterales bacterium]
MKILVLAPHPFFLERGTPIAVRALIEVLARAGHALDVLTYPEGLDVAIPGCTIHRVPSLPGLRNVPPGFSFRKLAYDVMMAPMALARIASRRYDVIHAVEESAFMAATGCAWFGTPYVYDMDSSLPQQLEERFPALQPVRRVMERCEAYAVRHSVAVVGMCRSVVDTALRYAPDLPASVIEDFSLLSPDDPPVESLRDEVGGPGPLVLYVGNLEPYQGIDLLLDAVAHVRTRLGTARLVVLGGSPGTVAHYRERARSLGLGGLTHFLGPRPLASLGAYLHQADVLVSPRLTGHNTPMKVYSYLDAGRPLLATRLATHTQVMDDETAMLADPEPRAFGEALVALLDDPGRGARLAAAARERVRREYSREAFARKVRAFYADVERRLNERRAAGGAR